MTDFGNRLLLFVKCTGIFYIIVTTQPKYSCPAQAEEFGYAACQLDWHPLYCLAVTTQLERVQ
jgi:hypothetical protein